jgi:7-carboxy-7-deazaguanine synthase
VTSSDLLVNEIFGPTVQGEGPFAGRECIFVRMANCNLTCIYCDTSYTWAFTEAKAQKHRTAKQYAKADEIHRMTADEVFDRVCELRPPRPVQLIPYRTVGTTVVISGGEPLLQVVPLLGLVRRLNQADYKVHFETAGTRNPGALADYVDAWVVSPKTQNSGNDLINRYKPRVLHHFATVLRHKTWFKFVVSESSDLHEVDSIVREIEIHPDRVMIMPEGISTHEILTRARFLVGDVLERGYGLTLRSHVLIWGDERAH